jgi:hypothetical protein
MKKWETPVLSVLHRSTSAEKVLVICKHGTVPTSQPNVNWCATSCLVLVTTYCNACSGTNLS